MAGYTKLFNSILASTVWSESLETRVVWITLLAMAGKDGIAEGSIPGVAVFARVSQAAARRAIAALSSPDPDSRSQEHDGRRIEKVDGGWLILNHAKYRAKMGADERREYLKMKAREYRRQGVDKRSDSYTDVADRLPSRHNTKAEAEAIDQDRAYGADEPSANDERPKPKVNILTALARSFLKTADLSLPDSELSAQLKDMAAKMKLDYDGRSIQKAIDSARARYGRERV